MNNDRHNNNLPNQVHQQNNSNKNSRNTSHSNTPDSETTKNPSTQQHQHRQVIVPEPPSSSSAPNNEEDNFTAVVPQQHSSTATQQLETHHQSSSSKTVTPKRRRKSLSGPPMNGEQQGEESAGDDDEMMNVNDNNEVNNDNNLLKNIEPGTIVFPPVNYDGIRPFVPAKEIDWINAPLDSSLLFGFKNDEVHSEYLKFIHRDLITILICLPYSGGILYEILNAISSILFKNLSYIGCAIILCFAVTDAFCHLAIPVPSKMIIQIRRIVTFIAALQVCIQLSFPIWGSQITCHLMDSFLSDWGIDPGRAPIPDFLSERYFRECIGIVSPYSIITLVLSLTHIKLQLPFTLFLVTTNFVVTLLGQVFWPDYPTLKGGQLGAYLLIQFLALFFACGFLYFKEKLLQNQFSDSCLLEKNHRLATHAADQVDRLLCSMLPPSVLTRVLLNEPINDRTQSGTCFCSDMVSFTAWSSSRSVQDVVDLLNQICISADKLCHIIGVEKVITIGDAYICASNVAAPVSDHAARIARFAFAYQQSVEMISKTREDWKGVKFRVGVCSGPLFGTIFGTSQLRYEIYGETRIIAENIEKNGVPGKVLVSEATAELLMKNNNNENNKIKFECEKQQFELDLSSFLPSSSPSLRNPKSASSSSISLYVVAVNGDDQKSAIIHHQGRSESHAFTADSSNNNNTQNTDDDEKDREMRRNFLKERRLQKKKAEARLQRQKKRDQKQNNNNNNNNINTKSNEGTKDSNNNNTAVEMNDVLSDNDQGKIDSPSRQANNNDEQQSGQKKPHLSGGGSIREIEKYYSKRKYSWFIQEFEHSEAEFLDFARDKMSSIVLLCRSFFLIYSIGIMIAVPIQNATTFDTRSATLLGVSVFLSALCLLITIANQQYFTHRNDLFDMLASALSLLACPALCIGTAYIPGDSIVGNDAAYSAMLLVPLIADGITNIAALFRGIWFLGTVSIPLIAIQWEVPFMHANLVFLFLATILTFILLVFYEKILRRQFVEHIVASEYLKKTVEAGEEQKTLLESMVPSHVIPELVSWIAADMDSEKTIAREHISCVSFVKLIPRDGKSSQENDEVAHADWLSQSHIEVDRIMGDLVSNSSQRVSEDGATVMSHATGSLDDDGYEENSSSSSPGNSPLVLKKNKNNNSASSGYSSFASMNRFSIIKIKIVGEIILFAGPFDNNNNNNNNDSSSKQDLQRACLDMLKLFQRLTHDSSLFTASCGGHVGKLLAAVLGTERLCYDIFGDSLNSCSRLMSSLSSDGIRISEEFASTLLKKMNLEDDAIHSENATAEDLSGSGNSSLLTTNYKNHRFYKLSEEKQIDAKGKGVMKVRDVQVSQIIA